MRIRKHYAKLLLGTGRLCYSPPPSPPPPLIDRYQYFIPDAGGGALCRLNCSPWDVLDFQEEGEGGETEEKTVTISNVADQRDDIDRKKIKRTTRRGWKKRKAKGERDDEVNTSSTAAAIVVVATCNRNNGNGWNCSRPALPRHTLCGYHRRRLKASRKKDVIVDSSHPETDPIVEI